MECALAQHDTHIVLIQRNEGKYLQDWMDWHSALVGSDALTVIDHNSTDPTTLGILRELSRKKVNVLHFEGHFTQKHEELTRVISQQNASLVIPMDTDEYLLGCDIERSFDPAAHKKGVLDGLRASVRDSEFEKFKLGGLETDCEWPFNASCRMSRRHKSERDKTYYRRSTFVNTDQGNHFGESLHNRIQSKRYVCMYHRTKPPYLVWAKSVRNAMSYGYFSFSNGSYVQLKPCEGNGNHYCRYVLDNAQNYGARAFPKKS